MEHACVSKVSASLLGPSPKERSFASGSAANFRIRISVSVSDALDDHSRIHHGLRQSCYDWTAVTRSDHLLATSSLPIHSAIAAFPSSCTFGTWTYLKLFFQAGRAPRIFQSTQRHLFCLSSKIFKPFSTLGFSNSDAMRFSKCWHPCGILLADLEALPLDLKLRPPFRADAEPRTTIASVV